MIKMFKEKPTYLEALRWASSLLEDHKQETAIAYHVLLDMHHWSASDWFKAQRKIMDRQTWEKYQTIIQETVLHDYPFQYALGYAFFYDRYFKVTEDTLIPRADTEILVQEVMNYLASLSAKKREALEVIDIGTGTGILPIILKDKFPELSVTATDISSAALDVAKENASKYQVDIRFLAGDLFAPVPQEKFDLIISNPPYVSEHETSIMDNSVIKYEPYVAVFSKDEGYRLLKRLLRAIPNYISPKGRVFMEIGFRQTPLLLEYIEQLKINCQIKIYQDGLKCDRVLELQF